MRRLLVAALVLAASVPLVPVAVAHTCAGTSPDCVCPAPNDGQYHNHAGPTGSCTSGASATPGGAKAPSTQVAGVVLALGCAALLVARRR
jgi:hypothetical protein